MQHYSKSLLVIAHTPSPNTVSMASGILSGTRDEAIESVETTLVSPFDCDSEMVLSSDALILFTTENFGYMSGALKDFFDRVFYPCLAEPNRNNGTPYALVIKAGLDGTGTQTSVRKITTGLKWKPIHNDVLCKGQFEQRFIEDCRNLGQTVAASLDAGII